ncbi:hypothetical protein [Brucella sp. 2716]|uniref:hypothetical protein n=1 Tax=Brucella sp. 2716 TaxID=2975052 RepID=UPI00217D8915|nr:hypothetical protein [Brucella sp. 2716]UWF60940.1 hypothetical protein NYO66_12780 [Brucella sp. 2716]
MALGVAPTLDVRLFLLKLPVAGNSVLAKASEQQFHAGLTAFSECKITSSAGISIARPTILYSLFIAALVDNHRARSTLSKSKFPSGLDRSP